MWEDLPPGAVPALDKPPGRTWVWSEDGPRIDTNNKKIVAPLCEIAVSLPCSYCDANAPQIVWAMGDAVAEVMAALLDASEMCGDLKVDGTTHDRGVVASGP